MKNGGALVCLGSVCESAYPRECMQLCMAFSYFSSSKYRTLQDAFLAMDTHRSGFIDASELKVEPKDVNLVAGLGNC